MQIDCERVDCVHLDRQRVDLEHFFQKTLDKKDGFETGLKFFKVFWSSKRLFERGRIPHLYPISTLILKLNLLPWVKVCQYIS